MKKITVIGRGTVGALAVAHYRRWTEWDIDWIFDPSISPTSVGEGTNLVLPRSLHHSIDFDGIGMDAISATPKLGIWKRGWGSGKNFKHTFPSGLYGMHFSANDLHAYIYNKMLTDRKVKIIEENCKNYEELDSDFIMVCTGSPEKLTKDYKIRNNIPVNTATVFQCPWNNAHFNYSLTFAKKFGWVFGIPLKNRCSIGYIYNRNFNSEEEVIEDVQEILEEFNLVSSSIRTLNFTNYTRKQNFSERIVYNGNASFFLEPLEATSTGVADSILRTAFDIWSGNMSVNAANDWYEMYLNDIESMILLHYFAGSIYNSKFWKHAVSLGTSKIISDINIQNNMGKILKESLFYNSSHFDSAPNEVGTWPMRSYLQNIDGMGIKNKLKTLL